jgi:hypothetical protein
VKLHTDEFLKGYEELGAAMACSENRKTLKAILRVCIHDRSGPIGSGYWNHCYFVTFIS